MFNFIYIEEEVRAHSRCEQIVSRFPKAKRILVDHYGQLFNVRKQNFRLQKDKPALILAKKHGRYLVPAPCGDSVGLKHNFVVSPLLNCPYDCAYCYLKGTYMSAHHVVFVNYEDFADAMERQAKQLKGESCTFFAGYDSDPVAFEWFSGFCAFAIPIVSSLPNAGIELRTKCTQTHIWKVYSPNEHVIPAFSLLPQGISKLVEKKAPSIRSRIAAMAELAKQGWHLGLRLDPLVFCSDMRQKYETLFENMFASISPANIHSVTLGALRFPKPVFEKMLKLYPDDKLLNAALVQEKNVVTYPKHIKQELMGTCKNLLLQKLPESKIWVQGTQ